MNFFKTTNVLTALSMLSTGLVICMEAPTFVPAPEHVQQITGLTNTFTVDGGLNYGMTLKQIQDHIEQFLKKQYEKGLVVTEAEFERMKGNWKQTAPNLSRVFGVEYLNKLYSDQSYTNSCGEQYTIKTPDYLLVVKDLNEIKVMIKWNECWPAIANVQNGVLYSRRVHHGENAERKEIGDDLVLKSHFIDFAAGNILKTPNHEYYVVDTESKSFDRVDLFMELGMRPSIRKKTCEYLSKKFLMDNHIVPLAGDGVHGNSVYSFSVKN